MAYEPPADAAINQGGGILSNDGRLFGLINIVDAAIILGVLVIIGGGIFFVASPDAETETETRYVTIDMGSQPEHIARQVTEGDEGSNDLTLTNVYKSVTSDDEGDVSVVVEAEVNASIPIDADEPDAIDEGALFDGSELRFGRTLEVETSDYTIEGEVVDVGEEPTLEIESQPMVLRTEVDSNEVENIQTGDEFERGGDVVLTIESLTVYATGDPDVRRAIIGATAETRNVDGTTYLGDQVLRTGVSVPIQTSAYDLSTTVIDRGDLEEPGTPSSRTVTMQFDQLPTFLADSVSEGSTETINGEQTAEVLSKTESETEVIEEDDNSTDEEIDDPEVRDVELTVELSVRERGETLLFRNEPLRIGQDLTLELDGVPIEGEVRQIE